MNDKIHFQESFDAEKWEGKDWIGHKFISCSFNHVSLAPTPETTSGLYGVTWYGCSAIYLEAQEVRFVHFTAQDCDFRHANFKGTHWERSQVAKSDFTWASFAGADLRGFGGHQNNFSISRLQMATINPYDRDMVSELIRCEANGDTEVLMIASLVKNSMEFCWQDWKTIGEMPQWQRVAEVIKKVLGKYPWLNEKLGDHVMED